MAKMRLCPRCGISLIEVKPGLFRCPRGHGEWWDDQGISSAPRVHNTNNGSVCDSGPIEIKGTHPSGKKNKKIKRSQWAVDHMEL